MIIDRKPGYTNEMMVKQLEILERVLSQTKKVKIGRGKKSKIINVLKYPDSVNQLETIKLSIKHYKKNIDEKNGNT